MVGENWAQLEWIRSLRMWMERMHMNIVDKCEQSVLMWTQGTDVNEAYSREQKNLLYNAQTSM